VHRLAREGYKVFSSKYTNQGMLLQTDRPPASNFVVVDILLLFLQLQHEQVRHDPTLSVCARTDRPLPVLPPQLRLQDVHRQNVTETNAG
jgi:hypothetical protein